MDHDLAASLVARGVPRPLALLEAVRYTEALHPRGRAGRWTKKLGGGLELRGERRGALGEPAADVYVRGRRVGGVRATPTGWRGVHHGTNAGVSHSTAAGAAHAIANLEPSRGIPPASEFRGARPRKGKRPPAGTRSPGAKSLDDRAQAALVKEYEGRGIPTADAKRLAAKRHATVKSMGGWGEPEVAAAEERASGALLARVSRELGAKSPGVDLSQNPRAANSLHRRMKLWDGKVERLQRAVDAARRETYAGEQEATLERDLRDLADAKRKRAAVYAEADAAIRATPASEIAKRRAVGARSPGVPADAEGAAYRLQKVLDEMAGEELDGGASAAELKRLIQNEADAAWGMFVADGFPHMPDYLPDFIDIEYDADGWPNVKVKKR